MIHWKQHLIPDTFSIREAMIRLNELAIVNVDVFVVDNKNHLLGSVSDGDIRRSLIRGAEMSDSISTAMNKNCLFAVGFQPGKDLIGQCKSKSIRFLPLLSGDREIIHVQDLDQVDGIVPVDAIIMAGGEGKRLKPLTDNLPKPLLPIGGKPIIEYNIDRLIKYGISNIHISINYLGNMLQEYFKDGSSKKIRIDYITENKPMGTVGAVAMVNNWQTDNILIMNSDLLTDIDFADFYAEFLASKADLGVAAVPYHVNIPYAVLKTGEGNLVEELSEKPSFIYYSNAGIYFLKRKVLDFIPQDCSYDMPDLIQNLINSGLKVFSYPIRGYWLDIGKMNDYLKAQEDIKHLKL
jgi:dTDP-glucose pyrophosphorylase/CBS domain-containing protein